jgi:DNA-binding NarL/FixJ family response regulator
MKFLIIEDDLYKAQKVMGCLKGHEFECEISCNTGLRNLFEKSSEYDGVILDMGLPTFDEGDCYESDNGLWVLSEMQREKIEIPVLIHSGNQYDVSDFNNVFGYIIAGQYTINKQVDEFLSLLPGYKGSMERERELSIS